MSLYSIPVIIDKKIIPFIKSKSAITLKIDTSSIPSGFSNIVIDLREGVDLDMLNIVGNLSIKLDFESIKHISDKIEPVITKNKNEEVKQDRPKPALPYVENEYDEVREKIGEKLGDPVQSLFPAKESKLVKSGNNELLEIQKQMSILASKLNKIQNNVTIENDELSSLPDPEVKENKIIRNVQKRQKTIMSLEELENCISEAGEDMPDIDLSKKLTKEEALELEKYKIDKPAYVISTKGQLFIEDIGVSIKPSVATNLSSILLVKLKKSNQLFGCFKKNMLKFITEQDAIKLSESAELTSKNEGTESKLKTFVGENGADRAKLTPVDLTSDSEGESEEMEINDYPEENLSEINLHKDSLEISEDVEVNEEDGESFLLDTIDLSGSGSTGEPPSDAMKSSMKSKQANFSSNKWKTIKNLDR